MSTEAVAAYSAIPALTAYGCGEYLLVRDGQSSFFVDPADITDEAMDAYAATIEAGDPDASAWTTLCDTVGGIPFSDVPAEVRDAARVELGGDDLEDDELTW